MQHVDKAQDILKCTFHEFEYMWGTTRTSGWRSDPLFNPYEVNSNKVKNSWREFNDIDCRFFDGPVRPPEELIDADEVEGDVPVMRVYLMPGLPVPYIPAVVGFRTGDEMTPVGSFDSNRLSELREQLYAIHAIAPFEIWYAEQSAFVAEFLELPKRSVAARIAEQLRAAVPDGFRGMSQPRLVDRMCQVGSFMVGIG